MLQAVVIDGVAQREQPAVFAVVARPEKRHRLRRHPPVGGQPLLRDGERGAAVGGHAEVDRHLRRAEVQGLEDLPREHRRVDQRVEAGGGEGQRAVPARALLRFESGVVFPSGRQAQGRAHRDLPGVRPQRIDQEIVPVDDQQVGRGIGGLAVAEAVDVLRRREVVEGHLHLPRPGRHLDLDQEHLQGIAPPGEGLAVRRYGESGHLHDGTARRVLPLHPFRIGERQRPGRGRDHQPGVEHPARRVRGVHRQLQGAGRRREGRGGGQEQGGQRDTQADPGAGHWLLLFRC